MENSKLTKQDTDFLEILKNGVEEWKVGKGIVIFQEKDGNWIGGMKKLGKFITAREVGPQDVLTRLLTHE